MQVSQQKLDNGRENLIMISKLFNLYEGAILHADSGKFSNKIPKIQYKTISIKMLPIF